MLTQWRDYTTPSWTVCATKISWNFASRDELAHGRDVRQRIRARRGGHGQRAQPASPDILNR
jgi:hypothetical protein